LPGTLVGNNSGPTGIVFVITADDLSTDPAGLIVFIAGIPAVAE
jgi:hypothetical protein